jgi:pyruvate dehydrogenase E1 component
MFPQFSEQFPDVDPQETAEWLESMDSVIHHAGEERARYLLYRMFVHARRRNVGVPPLTQTAYVNTIPPHEEPTFPGDEALERRIRRLIRWNAMAMVTRGNHRFPGLGGHISTYASSASIYEVGFNHFFRGKDARSGDQIFYQGHAAPGIYARAFLEGRLSESHLEHFRREVVEGKGLSSYPHPQLMPDFWEFPTVSMGLGPITAIYQARMNRYLAARGVADTEACRVWAFLGDGECDEPEALAGLGIAAREKLDNLVFLVNCNLQRLDGPVRGNGKIIQELEGVFRGAGWNVIKVVWAREWDDLLANDVDGLLAQKMMDTLDGEYQKLTVESGAYIREHFFGPDPVLRAMVDHLSDDELAKLRRGGHDYSKIYAAMKVASEHRGSPTAILFKTVKGWTLGEGFEARNMTHQMKKLGKKELMTFRDRLELPIPDAQLAEAPPYFNPGPESEEVRYMLERRRMLGGSLPKRLVRPRAVALPPDEVFAEFAHGSKGQEVSTTMGFVRLLRGLLRSKEFGSRVVTIVPDEARTFGMEGLIKEFAIYTPFGQRYVPVDASLLLSYEESARGAILEEGITEAGSMASFTAAATAYATHGEPAIPFYLFYSMFGFQRTMDQVWAAADARSRGFMMGATAGRTTLNGEGLQHADGHSHLLASAVPAVRPYDPAFAYEIAAIVKDGLRRMLQSGEDVIYYITIYNENYEMPPMPAGIESGILDGLYRFREASAALPHRAQILASGPIVRAALKAQEILESRYDVAADVWSATSFTLLRREALACEKWNRENAGSPERVPLVTRLLQPTKGPIVAASDWVRAFPDQIARWTPRPLASLGTDGFGRSDTRDALRRYFGIDAATITYSVLAELAREGRVPATLPEKARRDLGLDGAEPPAGAGVPETVPVGNGRQERSAPR